MSKWRAHSTEASRTNRKQMTAVPVYRDVDLLLGTLSAFALTGLMLTLIIRPTRYRSR
jgi:hypothetical protein